MPGDPLVEAVVWTLRPPDRDPPRLGRLSAAQESVVVAVLEHLAFSPHSRSQDLALQVLEEYWIPGALYRYALGTARGSGLVHCGRRALAAGEDAMASSNPKPGGDAVAEPLDLTALIPEHFERYFHFFRPGHREGILPSRIKELARLKVAALNQCDT